MNIFQTLLNGFCSNIARGNSWLLFGVILGISGIICGLLCLWMKQNILVEWAYEPIIETPKDLQQTPFVKAWFTLTRGFGYVTRSKQGTKTLDAMKESMHGPILEPSMAPLFSGWAFIHALQHFFIAFVCPKLVYMSFIYGIVWEVFEATMNCHCVLDIFWNMCGCILGILCRSLLLGDVTQQCK